jgi:hypothetical protein
MRIISFLLLVGIISCQSRENNSDKLTERNFSSEAKEQIDSSNQNGISNNPERIYNEYEVTPQDSLFLKLDPEWKAITEQEFAKYERNYRPTCQLDSSGFIKGKGLIMKTECEQICTTSLVEMGSDNLMILPCTYDQGILGLSFSNSCDQFITYSAYDSPDFNKYYQYRSELIGFKITQGTGLGCIKPFFKYYNEEWSIEKLIWVTDKKIAIRVYTQEMPAIGNGFHFQYYTTEL